MKKTLSFTCLAILMLCSRAYSQSNLTWTFKDKGEKGFFKTNTAFNSNFSGFTTIDESSKFIAKIKSNPEVASVTVLSTDTKGNCDVIVNMKQPHEKMYYVALAQKLEVAYIQYDNKKKTPAEIIQASRNKK